MKSTPILLALTATCALNAAAHADLFYTFDTDAQGWTSINDTSFHGWDGTLGNPDTGALRGVDRASGAIWYNAAPVADLGDLSGLYTNAISYDILGINGSQSGLSDRADIILSGAAMDIGINISTQPVNGQWTSWSALVDDTAGWEILSSTSSGTLSGTLVNAAQIQAVLSDVQGLYIRGEYTNGGDSSAIDNVRIAPAPGTLALLGLGALAARRRR